ncbi:CRISPR-associated endonuclease Cas2 [Patescibacteria group bacterium]|nr:CRISPR-associated endonuclease Cas2 [Patescibacteria group bacterium]MBU4458798.1 CRISPR-associated endonuclease Cas2 [Patescibacteria group bacterium]MCG2696398.1 CRISPR-associated endonuclease Cas2 [Candidatus Portnoybacteria bacterium]
MKIRLTEKLLWDIWKLIKIKDQIKDEALSGKWYGFKDPFEMIWPDFYGIRDVYWKKYRDKNKKERFTRMVRYLKNKGYLQVKDLKNRKAVMITDHGMKKIFNIGIKLKNRKQRPDKKWQMVLFDIPETSRRSRDLFRRQLKYLGYQNLQKSIFVCPYDVLKVTQQLIKNYKLQRFVRLLLVEEIKI